MNKIQQLKCSKASGGKIQDIPEECWIDDNHWLAERKYDGTRILMHITPEGNRFTTRRISEKTGEYMERTENFPHLNRLHFKILEGTVLDGEMFIKDFKTTQGIISSNPEESIERQKKTGYINYIVFDILFYKYNDLRTQTFKTRRAMLEGLFNNNELSPFMILSEIIHINKYEFYQNQISQGLEGTMLKNIYSDYYNKNGLLKVKKTERYTMLIKGYTKGQGKYTGQIGAILVGWNDHENLTKASGMDDEIRLKISQNPEKYLNTVVEIEGAELTEKKRLRHPRFIDWRIDKTEKDCSVNQNAIIK